MPEYLESALVYMLSGGVLVFLAVKEFAAYRLPANHRLNELLNPRVETFTRRASLSDWEVPETEEK